MMNVYVTALGISSSLGNGIKKNWQATESGVSGIKEMVFQNPELDDFAAITAPAEQFDKSDRLYEMTEAAFKEVIESGELDKAAVSDTAFIFAHGTPDSAIVMREGSRLKRTGRTHPQTVYRSMNSYVAAQISRKFELSNTVISNSSACSGSAQALHIGYGLIKAGIVERCICGGGEIIDYFTYMAFKAMRKVLTANESIDAIEPFGVNRSGIILGEGAGLVMLESEQSLAQRKVQPVAQVTNSIFKNVPQASYGDMPDHQPWQSVLNMLKNPEEINFVLAHATSTPKGDISEGKAIFNVLPQASVSSLKHIFGHTISASSIVDIAMLLEGYNNNTMLGVGKQYQLDPELADLNFLNYSKPEKINRAIKLSAGFGGGISCIEFQAV